MTVAELQAKIAELEIKLAAKTEMGGFDIEERKNNIVSVKSPKVTVGTAQAQRYSLIASSDTFKTVWLPYLRVKENLDALEAFCDAHPGHSQLNVHQQAGIDNGMRVPTDIGTAA